MPFPNLSCHLAPLTSVPRRSEQLLPRSVARRWPVQASRTARTCPVHAPGPARSRAPSGAANWRNGRTLPCLGCVLRAGFHLTGFRVTRVGLDPSKFMKKVELSEKRLLSEIASYNFPGSAGCCPVKTDLNFITVQNFLAATKNKPKKTHCMLPRWN